MLFSCKTANKVFREVLHNLIMFDPPRLIFIIFFVFVLSNPVPNESQGVSEFTDRFNVLDSSSKQLDLRDTIIADDLNQIPKNA